MSMTGADVSSGEQIIQIYVYILAVDGYKIKIIFTDFQPKAGSTLF